MGFRFYARSLTRTVQGLTHGLDAAAPTDNIQTHIESIPEMTYPPLLVGAETLETEARGLSAMATSLKDQHSALARAFFAAFETIKSTKGRAMITGMGKSGHVARKIAATLASTGCLSSYVHPGEASHGDLGMIGDDDCVVALSNSGETPELSDVIAYCGRYEIPLIAMTARADSALGRAADIVLELPDVPEACAETRAPTTSTTMSLALGDALAVALLRDRGFTKDDFRVFHPGGKLGASLKKVSHMMHEGRDLPLVEQGTDMSTAITILNNGGFGCVGVTHDGALVGIITDGDIRRRMDQDLLSLPVDSVMSRNPKTVTPETLAAEALGILSKTKITALFVVEGQIPVGLIHVHDMLATGVA